MVQLKQHRFAILKKWYPNDIRSVTDRAHKACLANLGLHPFPTDVDLGRIVGDRLQERIRTLADALLDHRGPMQLVRAVFDRICREMRVPTVEGRRQLRYMIAHWVTTRLPDGRGGVSTATDSVLPLDSADVIDVLDPTCRPSEWLSNPSATAAGASASSSPVDPAPSADVKPSDFAGISEDLVRRWLSIREKEVDNHIQLQRERLEFDERMQREQLHTRIEEVRISREPDRLRAEAELETARRRQAPERSVADRADADAAAPPAKRPRRAPTETLDDLRRHHSRYSVGHAVYDRLAAAVPSGVDPPDLRRVCGLVADWLTARADRSPRLDVTLRYHGELLLVYAFGPPHPRRYVPEAALLADVRRQLWPDADAPGPAAPEATTGDDAGAEAPPDGPPTGEAAAPPPRRVADIFLPPTPVETPADLAPVPLDRQRRDIERIGALIGVPPHAWPGGPAAMPAPPRDQCFH
jgi:hypothetical protein